MTRFVIEHEWLDGFVRSAAPELQATWAHVSIRVDDSPLIVGRDTETGALRHHLNVPLYPIAEWIAFNWWLLFENNRALPFDKVDQRSMRAASDGFVWPNISFVPDGDMIRVNVQPLRATRDQYLSFEGRQPLWLEPAEVRRSFVDVVEAVEQRLNSVGVKPTALHDEWIRLQSLDEEEQLFCRVAAKLGMDPFSDGVAFAELINNAFEHLPREVLEEFAAVAPIESLDESMHWVTDRIEELNTVAEPTPGRLTLNMVEDAMVSTERIEARPWSWAYDAARNVRELAGIGLTDLLNDLPVTVVPANQDNQTAPQQNGLNAVGRRVSSSSLAISGWRLGNVASRFQEARVLALVALQQDATYVLSTYGQSPSQKVSRAFAAELLAPARGIQQLLGFVPDPDFAPAIEYCADHFKVSTMVIEHQIQNQLS